jgi:hypothetical protein
MLKFLKMMVAEDVITTEEVLVVVVLRKKFCSKKRRQFAPRREGSGGGEATETQVLEGDLVEEALLQEKEVLAEEVQSQGEGSSDRAQDVLKVLVTHLDQEDQEETNIYC